MEKLEIQRFLDVDEFPQNYGYGHGSGNGYGCGYGSGYGDGYDWDDDDYDDDASYKADYTDRDYGYGYGENYENGYDLHIKSINGDTIYLIDDVPTIIDSIHGNYAKGHILNSDLTTTPCFIVKSGNFFAHGKTLKDAFADVKKKYEKSLPLKERIKLFNTEFPENDKPVAGIILFEWHNILTGSCFMGRKQFCRDKGLDIDDTYTVKEFISLTENAYGGNVIKYLKESRGI